MTEGDREIGREGGRDRHRPRVASATKNHDGNNAAFPRNYLVCLHTRCGIFARMSMSVVPTAPLLLWAIKRPHYAMVTLDLNVNGKYYYGVVAAVERDIFCVGSVERDRSLGPPAGLRRFLLKYSYQNCLSFPKREILVCNISGYSRGNLNQSSIYTATYSQVYSKNARISSSIPKII